MILYTGGFFPIIFHHHIQAWQSVAGWWYTYPSEKYESQLGWWHSQLNRKIKVMFQTTNQYLYITIVIPLYIDIQLSTPLRIPGFPLGPRHPFIQGGHLVAHVDRGLELFTVGNNTYSHEYTIYINKCIYALLQCITYYIYIYVYIYIYTHEVCIYRYLYLYMYVYI